MDCNNDGLVLEAKSQGMSIPPELFPMSYLGPSRRVERFLRKRSTHRVDGFRYFAHCGKKMGESILFARAIHGVGEGRKAICYAHLLYSEACLPAMYFLSCFAEPVFIILQQEYWSKTRGMNFFIGPQILTVNVV